MTDWSSLQAPSLAEMEDLARTAFERLPDAFRALCRDLVIRVDDFPDDETLRELIGASPDGAAAVRAQLTELGEVCQSVVLARRFANDATRAAVHVRRRAVVRALRLAGHAPWPSSRDMDDAPPPALTQMVLHSA